MNINRGPWGESEFFSRAGLCLKHFDTNAGLGHVLFRKLVVFVVVERGSLSCVAARGHTNVCFLC